MHCRAPSPWPGLLNFTESAPSHLSAGPKRRHTHLQDIPRFLIWSYTRLRPSPGRPFHCFLHLLCLSAAYYLLYLLKRGSPGETRAGIPRHLRRIPVPVRRRGSDKRREARAYPVCQRSRSLLDRGQGGWKCHRIDPRGHPGGRRPKRELGLSRKRTLGTPPDVSSWTELRPTDCLGYQGLPSWLAMLRNRANAMHSKNCY